MRGETHGGRGSWSGVGRTVGCRTKVDGNGTDWNRGNGSRYESLELIDKCLLDGGLLRLVKRHGLEGVLNGGDVGVEAMLLFGHQRHRIMEVIELGDNLFLLQFKLQISVSKFRHSGRG